MGTHSCPSTALLPASPGPAPSKARLCPRQLRMAPGVPSRPVPSGTPRPAPGTTSLRRGLPPLGGALGAQPGEAPPLCPPRPMSALCFGGKRGGGGGVSRKRRSRLPVAAGAMSEGRPLRLLSLHGYRQSERRFRQRTGALRKALRGRAELVAVNAPHVVPGGEGDDDGDDPPRGWWFSGPRTFDAGEVAAAPAGLEESLSAVAAALAEHGPFDGLLGFSQGAALAAMVCALRARGDPRFPVAFAILVAGFASRAPAHGHFYREPIALPTLHVVGEADAVIAAPLSRELAQRFVEPVVLTHPGGHFVPAAAPQKKAYLEFLDRFHPGQGQADPPGTEAV
ncbi:PREDICTED: ovarian cancer-associated gene 2 protein [Calidris pugnax]|uniref:ovarian cancer-associated gene 2 protein n=1 Tax=Calidris pugnax TaxID=198806 RepID=UPI00071C494A|nr:PREDICTED: ovarian cancer-associated gene 2 protein [Calidris pugnax]